MPERSVRLSYLGHAMFLIQTRGGVEIVTDYNGALPAGRTSTLRSPPVRTDAAITVS